MNQNINNISQRTVESTAILYAKGLPDCEILLKNMNQVKCKCITCNKEFYTYYCYIKRDGKRLYCSLSCRNISGNRNPRYKANEGWVICKGCGIKFKVKPVLLKLNKHKRYCSKECRNMKIGKINMICKECGNIFISHISQSERRSFCSRECSSRSNYRENGQINKGVQRGKGGKRIDLDNRYFRSSWEANYARYLNFLVKQGDIIKWEYEVDTFEFFKIKKGTRFYTPDFKIFINNSFEYHEVKGWMDSKSKTRSKRMIKYYPSITIKIIDKAWFRSNGKILSKIIPNWESKVY